MSFRWKRYASPTRNRSISCSTALSLTECASRAHLLSISKIPKFSLGSNTLLLYDVREKSSLNDRSSMELLLYNTK